MFFQVALGTGQSGGSVAAASGRFFELFFRWLEHQVQVSSVEFFRGLSLPSQGGDTGCNPVGATRTSYFSTPICPPENSYRSPLIIDGHGSPFLYSTLFSIFKTVPWIFEPQYESSLRDSA